MCEPTSNHLREPRSIRDHYAILFDADLEFEFLRDGCADVTNGQHAFTMIATFIGIRELNETTIFLEHFSVTGDDESPAKLPIDPWQRIQLFHD